MCIFCDVTPKKVRQYGKVFGYPDCCIEEFVVDQQLTNTSGIDVRSPEQIQIAEQTYGFVPCKMHTDMIMSGEVTVDQLVEGKRDDKKAAKLNKKAAESEW